MTEAEWLACTDPAPMLEFVRGRASDRKVRLFGCACVRVVWLFIGVEGPAAVDAAEGFADGTVTKAVLRRCRRKLRKERYGLEVAEAGMRPLWGAYWLTEVAASENAYGSVITELNRLPDVLILTLEAGRLSTFCGPLHDIFGPLPFRAVTVQPHVLAWNGRLVPRLAQAIYDERRWGDMPFLGDALLDAGCDNEEVLAHCRASGGHVRGCWVVDLLLGKS